MRVIAGTARSIPLVTLEGQDTRPTTDRIKETLFNMISGEIYDCAFLDLFAGSGAIGIEALSRGAREAVFVESNPKAAVCIEKNLEKTRLGDKAQIMKTDVISALERLEGSKQFDCIFMDPPYNKEWEKKVLMRLQTLHLLADRALIIIEADLKTDFSYVEELGYTLLKRKDYKTNKHVFLEKRG